MMPSEQTIPLREQLAGLAAFLPMFTAPDFQFGEWFQPTPSGPGVGSMPYFLLSEAAREFVHAAYDLGWVRPDIDWGAWQGTPECERLRDNAAALVDATAEQLARLLTLYIRGDRFCEGALAEAYESGLLVRILRRAETLLVEQGEGGQQ